MSDPLLSILAHALSRVEPYYNLLPATAVAEIRAALEVYRAEVAKETETP